MSVNDLITGMLKEEGGFQKALKDILENELNMTVNEFCNETSIPQSTMYKILEEKREPNLRTVRMIVKAIRSLSKTDGNDYIAVIASHVVFENLQKTIEINGRTVVMKEYPVATVEDAIIASVRAERDVALAIICAPIVAPTVEKIVSIPVSTVVPTNSVMRAVDRVKKDIY